MTKPEHSAGSTAATQRRTKLLVSIVATAGAIGIFVLPWFIPLQQPVTSLSYTFGFNNFGAWLAAAGLLAALCFILLWRRRTLGASALERRLGEIIPNGGGFHNSNRLFAAFLVVAVLGAVLQIVFYSILPTNQFGEIKQHVARLDLMILGLRPHLDFQYNFGPGMLYLAYGFYRLGAGALSIDTAYSLSLGAYWVIGAFLIYYIVSKLGADVRKVTVFLCISLLFLNPTMMGLQYTPLRYFLPLASLFFVHQLLATTFAGRYAVTAAAGFLLPLIGLSFSPEIGIATTIALTVYFLSLIRTPLWQFSYCALASTIAFPVARVSFGHDYLGAVQSYSSAASNFPIFPTTVVLVFLAAACLILPNLAILGLQERSPEGSLALGLVMVLGLEIPPALGRCDLVHICFNGAGIILFLLALLTTLKNKRLRNAMLCAYALLFPLGALTGMLWLGYADMGLKALHIGIFDAMDADEISISFARSAKPPSNAVSERATEGDKPVTVTRKLSKSGCLVMNISHRSRLQDWLDFDPLKRRSYGKPRYFSSDLSALLSYDKVGIPLGATEDIDRFLKITDRSSPEYWPRASSVGTAADVARKLRDLDTMNVILVPKDLYLDDNFLSIPVNSDLTLEGAPDPVLQRKTAADILTRVNMFPIWLPKARNLPFYYEVQIMAHVREHYIPVGEFRGSFIAQRRGDLHNLQVDLPKSDAPPTK